MTDEPPRVAVWRTEWLPGSETFIRDHVRYLQRWQGIKLTRQVTKFPLDQPDLFPSRLGWLQKFRGGELIRAGIQNRQLTRAVLASRARLIHAHFGTDATGILPVARAAELPLVVTLHGYDVTSMPRRPVIGAKYLRQLPALFDYASCFIAVSGHIRERAIALGAPPEKVVVHHTGIPLGHTATAGNAHRSGISVVGRLVEKKGVEHLLRAVHALPKPHRDIAVTVVGTGPLQPHLESLAAELSLNATFRSLLAPEEVRELLAQTLVVAVPSVTAANGDTEGLPTVILEAGILGAAVVATQHAGAPEVIQDGVNGLLVPEADVDSLAAALLRLLEDDVLRNRLAASAAANVAANFDLQHQTHELEQIYDDVVARWHRPGADVSLNFRRR